MKLQTINVSSKNTFFPKRSNLISLREAKRDNSLTYIDKIKSNNATFDQSGKVYFIFHIPFNTSVKY